MLKVNLKEFQKIEKFTGCKMSESASNFLNMSSDLYGWMDTNLFLEFLRAGINPEKSIKLFFYSNNYTINKINNIIDVNNNNIVVIAKSKKLKNDLIYFNFERLFKNTVEVQKYHEIRKSKEYTNLFIYQDKKTGDDLEYKRQKRKNIFDFYSNYKNIRIKKHVNNDYYYIYSYNKKILYYTYRSYLQLNNNIDKSGYYLVERQKELKARAQQLKAARSAAAAASYNYNNDVIILKNYKVDLSKMIFTTSSKYEDSCSIACMQDNQKIILTINKVLNKIELKKYNSIDNYKNDFENIINAINNLKNEMHSNYFVVGKTFYSNNYVLEKVTSGRFNWLKKWSDEKGEKTRITALKNGVNYLFINC